MSFVLMSKPSSVGAVVEVAFSPIRKQCCWIFQAIFQLHQRSISRYESDEHHHHETVFASRRLDIYVWIWRLQMLCVTADNTQGRSLNKEHIFQAISKLSIDSSRNKLVHILVAAETTLPYYSTSGFVVTNTFFRFSGGKLQCGHRTHKVRRPRACAR